MLKQETKHPIFKDYTIQEIAKKCLMNEVYIAQLAIGNRQVKMAFVIRASRGFDKQPEELFDMATVADYAKQSAVS